MLVSRATTFRARIVKRYTEKLVCVVGSAYFQTLRDTPAPLAAEARQSAAPASGTAGAGG
ncbi:hypothetical protein FHU30_001280 [Actinomadura rupiterrae]|nr:hypothetical protein [Actinomadura rupiterrae]